MKTYEYLQLQNFVDPGGYQNLELRGSKLQYKNQEWSYLASGLSRDVFLSEDGKSVLKIPQRVWNRNQSEFGLDKNEQWEYDHNRLEFEVYNESPEWCKKHIAKTDLTEDYLVIQEFVDVHYIGDAYWRELGYREDETCVIFDCDIFLDSSMKKPETGFKYEEVFENSRSIFDPEIPKKIQANKNLVRKQQREAREKYFPGLETGELNACSTTDFKSTHVYVFPTTITDPALRMSPEFEISLELAQKCGLR